jgi:hypothetical protein
VLEAVVSAADDDAAWQEDYVRAVQDNSTSDTAFKDKVLYQKGRLWIPNDLQLPEDILKAEHER